VTRARRAAWAIGVLGAIIGAGGVLFERVGASAIVYAPNAGHAPDAAGDPAPPAVAPPLVVRALRVDVGPPAASIAALVMEGPAPRATVFVLHGIRDRKESMLGWGTRLAADGFRAVLVDGRGHGRSSGAFLTYGVVESRDLSRVLDELVDEHLATAPIGAMGMSYGAATAIEWAGTDPRVASVVAVAPFASLRAVVPGYVRRFLPGIGGLIPDFMIARTIARAGEIAAFDPGAASPLDAIARTRAPVLLVHGSADVHIDPAQSEAIHRRAPDHSEVILVQGEDHETISADASGALWTRALPWLHRDLDAHHAPSAAPR
jgi:pimeloyl-ACP methyl ester carboxylesterase